MAEQTPSPPPLPSPARYGLLLFVALPCLPGLLFLLTGIIIDPHRQPRDSSPAGQIEYARQWERTRGLYLAGAVVLMGGTMISAGVVWKIARMAKAEQEGEAAGGIDAEQAATASATLPTGGYEAVLRAELEGREGSFLAMLRSGMTWDKAAFSRLVEAMEAGAVAHEKASALPRWAAEGFWHAGRFVRDWSEQPGFSREHAPEYYQAAYERLDDLAFWLFTGRCPKRQPLVRL